MWTKIALGVSLIANVVLISAVATPRPVPLLAKLRAERPMIAVSECSRQIDWNADQWRGLLYEAYAMQSRQSALESQALQAQQDFYSEAAREIRASRFR